MAILEIHKDGAPALKKTAKRVRKIDDNIRQLVEDMCETMAAANGVGLAANQVGIPRRIITVLFADGPRIFINPQIVAWSEECESRDEGCLSFPNIYGKVSRDLKVEVVSHDLDMKKHKFTAEGMGARVFQHEIDHLNGITFNTRAEPGTLREVLPEEIEAAAEAEAEECGDDEEYEMEEITVTEQPMTD